VIARDVGDAAAFAGPAQDLLDDIVVALLPEPAALEAPAVEHVAHQVEVVRVVMLEEVQQAVGLAGRGAEVNVRDPDGCGSSWGRVSFM
jgi:hypothetical protein